MSDTLIHFPLYIGDTLKKFIEYPTLQERGAWLSIVVALVQNDGFLPDDETLYFKCLAFHEQDKQVLKQTISKCLSKTVNGYESNEVNELILKQKGMREKRREAGAKGGKNSRRNKQVLKQSESESEPESESKTEIELKTESVRHTLSFKDISFKDEYLKAAADSGLTGEPALNCFKKWKVARQDSPPDNPLSNFRVWCLNEKKPVSAENAQSEKLSPEDTMIQTLGAAAWKRKNKMSLNPEQSSMLAKYESANGNVWWGTLKEYKKGK